ncbi:hypothetical protein BDY17DRAFT_96497 [Neohortaea acidophila]|uniref:Uncharacterized protein n=1 Tax=Neohortaea acidophila TaxID=245834 RepID=A0A6A6Q070_9PEZI|nr:uncharacterized protein BDY17DRAFT_96497 [Neohortaea acidophila]KAF2485083.1 hypothetical protein BDY17DRAFT_96497 [Neohortaea acidophila]
MTTCVGDYLTTLQMEIRPWLLRRDAHSLGLLYMEITTMLDAFRRTSSDAEWRMSAQQKSLVSHHNGLLASISKSVLPTLCSTGSQHDPWRLGSARAVHIQPRPELCISRCRMSPRSLIWSRPVRCNDQADQQGSHVDRRLIGHAPHPPPSPARASKL